MLLGNYNGIPSKIITPLDGIKSKLGNNTKVIFDNAVNYVSTLKDKKISSVTKKVAQADIVIYVGGISPRLEGEEGEAGGVEGFHKGDRTSIVLPKVQTDMMKAIKKAGKKLVFINMSGSAMGMEWEAKNADAIIQAWYGGQSAGTAIADILFGDYNPSGRLPITFYKNDSDLPDFESYDMKNRTYRYFKGTPMFEFGFGLSYSKYNYSRLTATPATINTKTLTFTIEIKNSGKMAGDEVAQLYVTPEKCNNDKPQPLKTLKAFKRIKLNVGETKLVTFTLDLLDLGGYSSLGEKMILPGKYTISIGGAQPSNQLFTGKSIEIEL